MGEDPFCSELLFTSQSPAPADPLQHKGIQNKPRELHFHRGGWEKRCLPLPFLLLIMIKHSGLTRSHGDPEHTWAFKPSLGGRQRVAAVV